MNNNKLNRNLWLLSGFAWTFTLFRRLSAEGASKDLILNAVTAILCFIVAYIEHRKINKDNTK